MTRSETSECWNATFAWTQRGMPSYPCVVISSAGPAFTSGSKRGRAGRCVLSARPPSAETRSSRSTAEGTPSKKTPGTRCHRGQRGSARSPRTTVASRASASVRASICRSASAPSPSACSLPRSTSATRGLAPPPAARRSTRRNSSSRRYSCGWPSYSCCGSFSPDRPSPCLGFTYPRYTLIRKVN